MIISKNKQCDKNGQALANVMCTQDAVPFLKPKWAEMENDYFKG